MRKYFQLFKITLQEYLVYRLNFILWRFRSFVSFVTLLIFWQAVYSSRENLFGYEKSQMIAYVIGVALLRGIVLGSRSIDMAGQIRSGELTKVILRPLGIFKFWLAKDLADKLLNIGFSLLEVLAVVKLFGLSFYFPAKAETYLLFIIILCLATFLYFFVSFAISSTAFWTDDPWATRWLFGIIFLEFMAGTYFPIDVLPKALANIFYLTPFPYLVYFPIRIWNEQVGGAIVLEKIIICAGWLVVFYVVSTKIWQKGIKNYGAYGG